MPPSTSANLIASLGNPCVPPAKAGEKREKWCKRAIWGNTLPAVKAVWKSVDKLTSGAFVEMWRERVAHFQSKYMATAAAERENQ